MSSLSVRENVGLVGPDRSLGHSSAFPLRSVFRILTDCSVDGWRILDETHGIEYQIDEVPLSSGVLEL